MQFRRLKTASAIVVAAAAVSAFASSAQAAVIDNFPFTMWGDADVTFSDANVAYDWSHSVIMPRVTGTMIVVDGDNARFRVAVKSYDISNHLLGDPAYDTPNGTAVHTDDATPIPVDMSATAAPNIAYVKVMLQKQGTTDKFVTKDYYNVGVLTHHDDVTILGKGIDVGGLGFAGHEPTSPATVLWTIGDDGKLKAAYSGRLHLDHGFYPGSGRVEIRALNDAGKVLATADGEECRPTDSGYDYCDDTLSVETADATRLKVKMQTADGTDPQTGDTIWQDDGEQIVSVAE